MTRYCLSVVILTFNSEKYVEQCIRSVVMHTKRSFELVIVDNGSVDGSVHVGRQLLEEYAIPYVFIQNKVNRGVAFARNQGIQVAQGQYVALLDVDTQLQNSALDILVEVLELNADFGIVGPRLIDPNGNVQHSARRFPTVVTKLKRGIGLNGNDLYVGLDSWDNVTIVDYVIGACQVFPRGIVDEIGPLDDHIFYGPEDVDFCLRCWEMGKKVAYVPYAYIVHHEQRVTHRRPVSRLTWRHATGLARYFFKHKYLFSPPRFN